jgi:hypothetical protein
LRKKQNNNSDQHIEEAQSENREVGQAWCSMCIIPIMCKWRLGGSLPKPSLSKMLANPVSINKLGVVALLVVPVTWEDLGKTMMI